MLVEISSWPIKKFVRIVLAFQLALLGIIGLDTIGIHVPLIREIIGFIYLTFIPGLILLWVLQISGFNEIETVLHTVGLSIAFVMFIGFFINIFFPYLGYLRPLSLFPIMMTITFVNLILLFTAYFKNSTHLNNLELLDNNKTKIISNFSPYLFILSIILLSLFGSYMMNIYHNNVLFIFLILIGAVSVIFIPFSKFFPINMYPLVIYILGLALLYHVSLMSTYIIGFDIQREYFLSNMILMDGKWNSEVYETVNGLLSLTILPIIYSIICDLNLIWVFKICYPLLFSFVSIGIYHVFQKQMDEKIAFLSSFYFISLPCFYFLMPQMAREEIAEIFFILIIILMVDQTINNAKKSILLVIYSFSLIVSHYGLSYIFLGMAALTIFLRYLNDCFPKFLGIPQSKTEAKIKEQTGDSSSLGSIFINYFHKRPINNITNNFFAKNFQDDATNLITTNFFLLFFVSCAAWYIIIANGSTFDVIVQMFLQISGSIFTDFLDPRSAQGLDIILSGTRSLPDSILKILYLCSYLLISIGLLNLILDKGNLKFKKIFSLFAIIAFMVLVAAIVVPNFSIKLNTIRLIQIMLFFLSPFCVIGIIYSFKIVSKLLSIQWKNYCEANSLRMLSIFLAIFFLFNSGLIHDITGTTYLSSISLNNISDNAIFSESEINCCKWLADKYDNKIIYSDVIRWVLLNSLVGTEHSKQVLLAQEPIDLFIPSDAYIFLSSQNIVRLDALINNGLKCGSDSASKDPIPVRNKLYDNSCLIYK